MFLMIEFGNHIFRYKIKRVIKRSIINFLFLFGLLINASGAFAQNIIAKNDTIKQNISNTHLINKIILEGVVTDEDSKTNDPIPFANVILCKGTNIIATTTDFDGKYKISLEYETSVQYLLKVNYISYDTASIAINIPKVILRNDKMPLYCLNYNVALEWDGEIIGCPVISTPEVGIDITINRSYDKYGPSPEHFELEPTSSGKTFYEDDLRHIPH